MIIFKTYQLIHYRFADEIITQTEEELYKYHEDSARQISMVKKFAHGNLL